MSETAPTADLTAILEFPGERNDLRWRGFLGAERIEHHIGGARTVSRVADDQPARLRAAS